ncbi:dehydrin DHN [Salix suchowensis]|nr:dehydrin DHN [Salix suchowensis]
MAGIMQKIEETFGGKKEEQRKGEPQAGLGQQGHNTQGGYGQQGYNAQGERKEGFVDNIKDKIPGGGGVGSGGMRKGETQGAYGQQGHNQQGGYGQQGHNTQGERKEGLVDKIKHKIPGCGGGGVDGGGERKK